MFLKRNEVCVAMSMEELDRAISALRKDYDDTKEILFRSFSAGVETASSVVIKKGMKTCSSALSKMMAARVEKCRDSVTYTRRAVYYVDYASEDMLCVDRFRIFSTLLLPEKGERREKNINAYMLAFRSVRGEDKIKELEEKAVRLAKKFKGSYAFSFFDESGSPLLYKRILYPLDYPHGGKDERTY